MVIGLLHQLTAGGAGKSGQVPGLVLLGRAHVQPMDAASRIMKFRALREGRKAHAGAPRQGLCRGFRQRARSVADRSGAPRLAMLKCLAGQGPTDGAVAQGSHRIRQPRIDERLRANQAARAACAVDDDAGARVGRQIARPQHQLGARHADAGRDAHGLVLVEAARVEHHHVVLLVQQGLHLLGRQRRRMRLRLDEFAKGLARHIDVAEQLAARRSPARQAAFKLRDIRVSQRRQTRGGARDQLRIECALTVQHDLDVESWHARQGLQLDQAQRQIHRKQRMRLRVRVFLAQIEQRQLASLPGLAPGLAHMVGAARWQCTHASSLERSQILGNWRLL